MKNSFISDTCNEIYTINTSINRFILNDVKLMKNMRLISATIKGIGGTATIIKVIAEIVITLESDNGHKDKIVVYDALYVLSSPYNILSPQLLLIMMKELDYTIYHSPHGNDNYFCHYLRPRSTTTTMTTLAIPITSNKLFILHTSRALTSFFRKAKHYAQ